MCWLSVVSIGTDLKACHRHHRGETFPSCVLCFCVPPVPSGSKPQVAVLAGKGVLVTYATPDQHHHEVPCHTALSTDPGDSGQTLLSMCPIKLKLVLKLMLQETQLILLRAITLAPKTTNMCLISMDFLEKFLPQWLHLKVM